MTDTSLILASASPRRKQLLEQIGIPFLVEASNIDEPPYTGHDPARYASDLATLKAVEISLKHPESLVVGADTIVVVGEKVLGKPADKGEAQKMLNQLSGRNHQVITAYSFQLKSLGIQQVHHVLTQVHFKPLHNFEIDQYIDSGAPFDKAGGYGIQDYSSVFVDRIEGCFYNVVGLPLSDFNEKLNKLIRSYSLHIL